MFFEWSSSLDGNQRRMKRLTRSVGMNWNGSGNARYGFKFTFCFLILKVVLAFGIVKQYHQVCSRAHALAVMLLTTPLPVSSSWVLPLWWHTEYLQQLWIEISVVSAESKHDHLLCLKSAASIVFSSMAVFDILRNQLHSTFFYLSSMIQGIFGLHTSRDSEYW